MHAVGKRRISTGKTVLVGVVVAVVVAVVVVVNDVVPDVVAVVVGVLDVVALEVTVLVAVVEVVGVVLVVKVVVVVGPNGMDESDASKELSNWSCQIGVHARCRRERECACVRERNTLMVVVPTEPPPR